MSLEQSIQNLADAVNALVGVVRASNGEAAPVAAGNESAPRGRGRPRKEPAQPESSAPLTDPTSRAASASSPASAAEPSGEAEVAAPAAAAAPSAAPAAASSPLAATAVTKEDIQKVLMAVAATGPSGRTKCVALCAKYGAKNISSMAPTHYAALLVDAQAALAELKQAG